MALTFKEKLAQKMNNNSTTTSKLGTKKLNLKGNTGESIRNKFKRTDQSILEKTYEDRKERSKSSNLGKTIFNQELMSKYGIGDFSTTPYGDRYFEILPISYKGNIPYFKEIAVHFGVGFTNDAFVCINRFEIPNARGICYRCKVQTMRYRDQKKYDKEETNKLFPTDRACYLLWERTKELLNSEPPEYTLKLWAAPKQKVHSEIINKTRNKISRETLDISDVSENGDGRTVGLSIVKQGEYPNYSGFELMDRDRPIPDEILEILDQIISDSEEQGFKNCIDMFLNIPTEDEIRESMETENLKEKEDSNQQSSRFVNPNKEDSNTSSSEEELMTQLQQLQEELESIAPNKFKWKKWCVDNGYEEALGMDIVEAIPAIIDDIYEKEIAKRNA